MFQPRYISINVPTVVTLADVKKIAFNHFPVYIKGRKGPLSPNDNRGFIFSTWALLQYRLIPLLS